MGIDWNGGIRIYPNPAENIFKIQLPENIIAEKIECFDNSGKRVSEIYLNEKNENPEINIHNWPTGIYWVRVLTESGEVFSGKLSKAE